MARIDVEQSDVLAAVIARLRDTLSLSDRHCYEVARAADAPSIPPGGDYWLTVAPGPGDFAEEEQAPGNVTESTDVIVTAYSRIKTDSTGHDHYMLVDDSRGLLKIKKLILGALCGQDLTNDSGNTFLRQTCFARRSTAPDLVRLQGSDNAFGSIQITFGVPFDWSL